ncbi:hypothetical protein V7O62_10845 [Methanolobus sp. ZRKC2]|uniref:hypothetical protein n=1 Tax=Methanolobus sp. ZRKC2 TaxID=3125783 RepID=UPI0032496D61
MDLLDSEIYFSDTCVVEKAISTLHDIKGIEKVLLTTEFDRKKITQLEDEDEKKSSLCFGKKNNVGIKKVLESDILISFVTNMEYEWPENNLKIVHRGEVIGEDISDASEIERLKKTKEYRVFGNIIVNRKKFKSIKGSINPPMVLIDAKPCPEIEKLEFVSEAMVASPSKLTDQYIKSKMGFKSKDHVGSFLVGFNYVSCKKSHLMLETKIQTHHCDPGSAFSP